MIFGSLDRAADYAALDPRLAAALRFLAAFGPYAGDGVHRLDDGGLVAEVRRYHTGPGKERRFRAHRRRVAVHYVAEGRERILHAPEAGLAVETPYAAAEDVVYYHDPPASSSVLLHAGDFAVLHPGDAYKPGCMAGGRDPVTTVVVRFEP